MEERTKEKKKAKQKEREELLKKNTVKKRTRGVKVPILNLPRPPRPVLMNEWMMNDEWWMIQKGSLNSLKLCTLKIYDI